MSRSSQAWRRELRFRVLRALEENPHASQREIARALGVSLGGINYCLRALVDKGHVKVRNFRKSGNKLAYAYVLTPKGIAEKGQLASAFLRQKLIEYEAIREELERLRKDLPDEEFEPGPRDDEAMRG